MNREKNTLLKSAFFERSKTQRLVSKETNIPEAVLSMIVNGKYIPDENQKREIAKALSYKVEDLFRLEMGASHG